MVTLHQGPNSTSSHTEPNGPSKPTIPTIDLSDYLSPSSLSARAACAASLIAAMHKTGIVYLTNHGIPSATINAAFALSKSLFALPYEQKMLAPHPASPHWHRGYSGPGLERVSKGERDITECKESYEVGSERDTVQPPVWLPEDVLPGFRARSTEFYWTMHAFALQMLAALALGLGVEDEQARAWAGSHLGNNCQLRLLHYPPVEADEVESGRAERMPGHTDWGTFTLLFQDECGGLQAWVPGEGEEKGEYVDVEPVEGAIVMNAGNMLERWSNGYCHASQHRVTLPPLTDRFNGEHRLTRERYSIPYFVSPELDTLVKTFPACTSEKQPANFEPVQYGEYMRMRAAGSYAEG